jgi:hypothetical protein
MQERHPWSTLRQSWSHISLPGYREFSGTYQSYPTNTLPPIPIELDDDCQWLITHSIAQGPGLNQYERDLQPATIIEMARRAGVDLPRSFARFMSTPDLQSRVRSCTDCYLDPGQRVVPTVGAIPGHLIYFLSDSQACMHWYLHVLSNGRAAVLESEDLYCYVVEDPEWVDYPTCSLTQVDLEKQQFSCSATSFSEFLYRFWIENEIWFALQHEDSRRPLKPLELAYVSHYTANSSQRTFPSG